MKMQRQAARHPAPGALCIRRSAAHVQTQPPWPNGQGVGLLIRRLRVRVPQGVLVESLTLALPRKAPPLLLLHQNSALARAIDIPRPRCAHSPRGPRPGNGHSAAQAHTQPPWPSGQGIGLRIRRSRVRAPPGVLIQSLPLALPRKATGLPLPLQSSALSQRGACMPMRLHAHEDVASSGAALRASSTLH